MNQDEILGLLQEIGGLEQYQQLPEYARLEVANILQELRDRGESPTLSKNWKEDFLRVPVSPEEFLSDEYYVGGMGKYLYPKWREELLYVLDAKNKITEWCITGSIGSGKSFSSIFAQAYKLYFLSCLKNPQRYYGLAEGTNIVFAVFNLTIQKTEITLYRDLKTLLDTSPYFRSTFPLRTVYGSRGEEKEVVMPRGIMLISGSQSVHALSTNVFSCILDEMNFRDKKYTKVSYSEQAESFKLYTNIKRRIRSRFFNPGVLILISSRQTITDFLEEHIERSREMPGVHISDFPLWEVKPKSVFYPSGKTFRMAVGNRSHFRTSRVLEDDEVIDSSDNLTIIENIPIELRQEAIMDPDGFVRDVAGVATFPTSPLIGPRERIGECIDHNRSHPFGSLSICLNIHTSDRIQDLLTHQKLVTDSGQRGYKPLVNPDFPRIVAVDLSKSGDSTGIAMGFPHSGKVITEKKFDPVSGKFEEITRPVWNYYIDFMLEIVPPSRSLGEIDFDKIEEFLIYIRDTLHYRIEKISFDGWQSVHMRQRLDKINFEAVIYSVDKKDDAYLELRQAIVEKRISYYEYPPFSEEIGFLQHDKARKKVDHLKGKKKDVCDAVASVVYHCSKYEIRPSLRPPTDLWLPGVEEAKPVSLYKEDFGKMIVSSYAKESSKGRKERKIIHIGG